MRGEMFSLGGSTAKSLALRGLVVLTAREGKMSRLRVSRLGKDPTHRKHMFRTMVTQLIKHERIKTTLPKKCGFRKFDKAPMAYIEYVDSPKEIGKRVEKRTKVYPTIEELREKAPAMDIYNKPVIHVSENKKTSLIGGMVTLINRLRSVPIPTVKELASTVSVPDLSAEFVNLPGPGQPLVQNYQDKIAKSAEDVKKHAKEVLEKRLVDEQDERARLRKLLHMEGTRKQLKAEKAAARAADAAKAGGEVKGEAKEAKEGVKGEVKSEGASKAEGDAAKQQQGNKPNQQNNKPNQQHQQQNNKHAKPQGNQQHQHNKNKNKNKNKHGKK